MIVIRARNVQQMLPVALAELAINGINRDSRNGPVRMFAEPVTSVYEKPLERVMFWPERDCNPFFHLMESLWMLAGRNDVEYPAMYVNSMRNFSDNGKTFHGAYGYRWRHHFHFDQLDSIVNTLRMNPDDRRCVLGIWDPEVDLGRPGKDFPCNLSVKFSITHEGKLDMAVYNRSNDVVWGAYGANAVHFSVLQEYMAIRIGVPVGVYRQVSDNLHAYESTLAPVADIADYQWNEPNPYYGGAVEPFPLIDNGMDIDEWESNLHSFLHADQYGDLGKSNFSSDFFEHVAKPMALAHRAWRNNEGIARFELALMHLEFCAASDWKLAATEWLLRRKTRYVEQVNAEKLQRAQDDGPDYETDHL